MHFLSTACSFVFVCNFGLYKVHAGIHTLHVPLTISLLHVFLCVMLLLAVQAVQYIYLHAQCKGPSCYYIVLCTYKLGIMSCTHNMYNRHIRKGCRNNTNSASSQYVYTQIVCMTYEMLRINSTEQAWLVSQDQWWLCATAKSKNATNILHIHKK